MGVTLLDGVTLSGTPTPSRPLIIEGERVSLQWTLVTTGGPTTVNYYLEFTDENPNDSASAWFREVDEADNGTGTVKMSKVVRTFAENGGASLADGTHQLSCQFVRQAQFVRLQVSVSAGAAVVTIDAPFGSIPV